MTVATTRRELLKMAALASAALALPAAGRAVQIGRGRTSYALGEIGGKTGLTAASVVPSICTYCSMGCSVDFYVANGSILWSSGSPDSYINWGALCPEGKAAFRLVDDEMRVLQPMIRTGPKPPPDEILSARSWDELVAVVKKYPPPCR